MPHLRFSGVQPDVVKTLSRELPERLATPCETTAENFTFELVPTQFFGRGESDDGYPFVDVIWFDRSAAAKTICAEIITDGIKKLTQAEDVAVVFTAVAKSDYFENGTHF